MIKRLVIGCVSVLWALISFIGSWLFVTACCLVLGVAIAWPMIHASDTQNIYWLLFYLPVVFLLAHIIKHQKPRS